MATAMPCKSGYEVHHHFPKVAEESGFAFNTHRPRLRVDWHKIRLIDIENVIRERRFTLIEQHINDILNCVLESEFDVRILDEGVLKMFRLAQLAVEYQQFCRHYLDRSVYVLREEIAALAQELDVTKKELREKDDEIRKLRKKPKQSYRQPLPYGNDNIATMILKTLANNSDLFPSTSNGEGVKYNKCSYCDKVFMNQLYLRGHISRRHANVSELPEKDQDNDQNVTNEKQNSKLTNEIAELKEKLKEMEHLIKSNTQENTTAVVPEVRTETAYNTTSNSSKLTKDAEVSTSNEDYLLDRIEEWKKEEHQKYNKELNLLRTQIIETMNSFKEKEEQNHSQYDLNIFEQLQTTIKQQGAEIVVLKTDLSMSREKSEEEETQRRKEAEAQISLWAKRTEAQSKQYEALLQKLNDMTKELQESRIVANKERDRAIYLEGLLQANLANHQTKADGDNLTNHVPVKKPLKKSFSVVGEDKPNKKTYSTNDSKSLQSLHRKAQELLSIGSSSSEVSNASTENTNVIHEKATKLLLGNNKIPNGPIRYNTKKSKYEPQHTTNEEVHGKAHKKKDNVKKILPKSKSSQSMEGIENSGTINHGSPIKVVRAKITEEVNNRLIAAGVDPLKSGLTKNVFQNQRMYLQQGYDAKSKKNPKYQKVKHSILTFLDSNSSFTKESRKNEITTENPDYVSPSKSGKLFNFSSVISNVKNKAMSLVKTNDNINMKVKRNALNAQVAKKETFMLKTSPDSVTASPVRNTADILTKDSKIIRSKKLVYNNVLLKKTPKRVLKQYTSTDESDGLPGSEHFKKQTSISVETLIKSPARRPSSANSIMKGPVKNISAVNNEQHLPRAQSETNVADCKTATVISQFRNNSNIDDDSSDTQSKKSSSEDNLQKKSKQTKGVLKNASSFSSLNKKKVIFDMDAIQMKSVSASPSQSITDKNNSNEMFELGLVNLNNEEWEISSIENDLKNDTQIQQNTRTSPKIAELKQTIESQLARRNFTLSTALVGGVDVLAGGSMVKAASIAGSNTSLGSSILDDSDASPIVKNKAFLKPKKTKTQKPESDLDLSEYSLDGITIDNNNKKDNESF